MRFEISRVKEGLGEFWNRRVDIGLIIRVKTTKLGIKCIWKHSNTLIK